MVDNENQKKLIGQRLNTALALRNMRQKDLAHALGIQDNTISYFCKGDRTPNTVQLAQICRILDVSADYLLGLTDAASTSADVQDVVKATGLSEASVKSMMDRENRRDGALELELANFLMDAVFQSDLIIPFEDMVRSLKVPSALGCAKVLLEEWPESDLPKELHIQAVMSGCESYFEGDEKNSRSHWTLEPESAFDYYCSVVAREIREQLTDRYDGQNQWGNLEGIREDLLRSVAQKAQELRKQAVPV